MAEKTATFGIRIDASTNADKAAESVEELRARILASQEAVKNYGASMRNLRGSSDEVKEAKERLKGAINAERDAISQATLKLGRHGVTYGEVTKKAKENEKETTRVKDAIRQLGGPVEDARQKFEALKVVGTGLTSGLGLLAVSFGVTAVAVAGLTAAVVAGTVSFAKFAFENANILRTQSLFREAATGSAENAKAFGHQIDALAVKIPTARDELQELSLDLSKAFVGTRISGQGIVDTFNAVAQEAAAMGKSAGSAVQNIIDRGKRFGRLQINPFELMGAGLGFGFQDVAAQLAKNLHIGIAAAQNELFMGRVRLDAGAKAIRDVVESRFAEINARRMLDLNVIVEKFHESLQALTSDIKLEPLANAVKDFFSQFSASTVAGAALKDLVTLLGNALIKQLVKGESSGKALFKALVLGAYNTVIAFVRVRNATRDFWQSHELLRTSVKAVGVGLGVIAATAAGIVLAFGAATAATVAFVGEMALLPGQIARAIGAEQIGEKLRTWVLVFKGIDWGELGMSLVRGIGDGIVKGYEYLKSKVLGAAQVVKNAFKGALGIQSPSKVFEAYGRQTAAGAASGMQKGTPSVARAAREMAPRPPALNAGARSGGGAPVNVTIQANFPNAKSGHEVAAALSAPSFLVQITKFFDDFNSSQGIPIQTALSDLAPGVP